MKQMRISVRKGDIMHFLEELSHIFDIVAGEREIDFIVNLEDTERGSLVLAFQTGTDSL